MNPTYDLHKLPPQLTFKTGIAVYQNETAHSKDYEYLTRLKVYTWCLNVTDWHCGTIIYHWCLGGGWDWNPASWSETLRKRRRHFRVALVAAKPGARGGLGAAQPSPAQEYANAAIFWILWAALKRAFVSPSPLGARPFQAHSAAPCPLLCGGCLLGQQHGLDVGEDAALSYGHST